jgi:hypothetical protein
MSDTIEAARERHFKKLAAFYACETEKHPAGKSGREFLTCPQDDRRCAGDHQWAAYCGQ